MSRTVDIFELESLGLATGEAKHLDFETTVSDLEHLGERYSVDPQVQSLAVDVSRTAGHGYALRLRFQARLHGRCARCLELAQPVIEVDTREIQQPGGGEELQSPYVSSNGELAVGQWAHDALLLALPPQVTCRTNCAGLCPECGENLNEHPDHTHDREPDDRWAKLSEVRFD